MNNPTKTEITVLVTVSVEHQPDTPITFINDLALESVSKNCVRGCDNDYGLYSSIATNKEIIDLDTLQTKAVNKYVSASLKASDSYY